MASEDESEKREALADAAAPTTEKSSKVGNAAAMREALVELTDKVLDYLHKGLIQLPLPFENAIAKANAALSAPPRQCDVGTPEEQTKRFSDFCAAHRHTDLPRCAGCPLENTPSDTGCSFAWAQMPYEAEEGCAE